MKVLLLSIISFLPVLLNAQAAIEYAVRLEAQVQDLPAVITLNWDAGTGSTGFDLYRKDPDQGSWMINLGSFPANTTSFIDSNVVSGQAYEYKLVKHSSGYTGYGYIMAGMQIPAVEDRGRLILIADSILDNQLQTDIQHLRSVLTADGWEVLYHVVLQNDSVQYVKNIIKTDFQADKNRTRTVFLLGHIPVPYSGVLNPDGHPNHRGAWPTDTYYGDMNGNWTDLYANNTSASQTRNHNVPGDGKFDQSLIPSDMELAVGRVDLYNLPAFSKSYIELTRDYINKDIAFRTTEFVPKQRAIIDDNFGGFGGEAFASSGWKSFSPLVGIQQVSAGDYRTSMDSASYIWSYGCGGGSFTSAGGIGNTANFATDSLQGVFSCLFGSYFGDWDISNNFLRAVLAQGTILTNAWSGRPHWYFHPMGLGNTIGTCDLLSVNKVGNNYYTPYAARFVSINLMGDPSLTQYIVAPPGPVTAIANSGGVELQWTASKDSVLGYFVFRAANQYGPFENISNTLTNDTFFNDVCIPDSGQWFYLVRAIKLQHSPSGTFYNLSNGSSSYVSFNGSMAVKANFTVNVIGGNAGFSNNSSNAVQYIWYFGDGDSSLLPDPVHSYPANGNYQVVLWASNDCFSDSTQQNIQIVAAGLNELLPDDFVVYPNPASNQITIDAGSLIIKQIRIINITGALVYQSKFSKQLDVHTLDPGVYFIELQTADNRKLIDKFIVKR